MVGGVGSRVQASLGKKAEEDSGEERRLALRQLCLQVEKYSHLDLKITAFS